MQSASAAGIFLNFKIDPATLRGFVLPFILAKGTAYGTNTRGNNILHVVEYSSPNIAKPFHAGHLRGTLIGNFIKNALIANGYTTKSVNYLGDWGKQYGLLAVGFGMYGSEEKLEQDPIRHLYDVYVKINAAADEDESLHGKARAYFKRMEDGMRAAHAGTSDDWLIFESY